MLIKPGGHGINTKVVDINIVHLIMQYETYPITQIWEKLEKLKFLIKTLIIKKIGTPEGHGVNTKVVDIDKICRFFVKVISN